MTVIAVWADGLEVTVAADTLASGGPAMAENRAWRNHRKLRRTRIHGAPAIVAVLGSSPLINVALRWTRPPRPVRDLDGWAVEWASRLTVEALRRRMSSTDDEHCVDGSWFVAFRGHAWVLGPHCAEQLAITAVGSGEAEARGALAVLCPQVDAGLLTRREALERAVGVACELTTDCGFPVQVERL